MNFKLSHSLEPVLGRLSRFSRQGQSRNWVVVSLLAGTTLMVGAIAMVSYSVVRGLVLDNLKQQQLLEVELGASQIDQWLAARKAEVSNLASSPTLNAMDWSVTVSYLRSEVNRIQEFHLFTMVNPDGMTYNTNVGQVSLNTDFRTRSWYVSAMRGETSVSDPAVNRMTGLAEVFVSAPVVSFPGSPPISILAGGIKLYRVVEVVQSLQQETGSYAFALNSQGMAIAHPDPQMMGTIDNPAPSFLQSPNAALAEIADRMVDRQQGIELVRIDGSWRYVAYVPLKEANWSIALVIPREHIESQLGALNLLATVLAVLLAIALATIWRQVQGAEQARTRAAQEALLNRLTSRIRESLELQTILQTTVTELAALIDLDRVVFGWYDPQRQTFEQICDFPEGQGDRQQFQFSPSLQLHTCLAAGKGVRLQPLSLDPDAAPLELTTNGYIAMEIPTQDGRSGYLISIHREALNREERELLKVVTDQLAIAITQSHLYSQTQEQVTLLNATLTQLKQTQLQLVQSEKMSSLGQLIAGIAHEINNPVNFIYGNLTHASQYASDLLDLIALYQTEYSSSTATIEEKTEEIDLEFLREDLPKLLSSMQVGAHRIREIVQSLRLFSRLDEAEVKNVNIHEGIDSTLMILQNRLKAKPDHPAIAVVKQYGDLPLVECYAGQLNQVFMNILSNAIDALDEFNASREAAEIEANPATITIKTNVLEDYPERGIASRRIAIHIVDNGPGMTEDVQHRLFDPFFTTKPVGKGTGMGLAISYQIVTERHGGELRCSSTLGEGTEFVIEIPTQQSKVHAMN